MKITRLPHLLYKHPTIYWIFVSKSTILLGSNRADFFRLCFYSA